MTATIHRRNFLQLAAAVSMGVVVFSPKTALGQVEEDTLILRPDIEGVDPRYAMYTTPGPYLVPANPVSFTTKRSKVVVFAPKNAKKARLIVFSHGALADPLTYRDLIWHWVSHGFVVAAPLHNDAVIESGPTLRKDIAGKFSEWPISKLLEDPIAWNSRVAACVECLNDVALIAKATETEIVTDRPIIAGHGYGGYVAQLLLGATVTAGSGGRLTFADPRFFSGIVMSPQGPGVMGLDEHSWEEVSAPTLYVVSENDLDFTGQPAKEKSRSYRLAKAGYKHMGYLNKGGSNTFSGQAAKTNPYEMKLFEALRALTTAYILAYGNYDPVAFKDMTTDFFSRMSLGVVTEGRR